MKTYCSLILCNNLYSGILTRNFHLWQISVTITEKFTAIKPESPEMSRTIMAVINEAGGGGEGGGGGADAVVTDIFSILVIYLLYLLILSLIQSFHPSMPFIYPSILSFVHRSVHPSIHPSSHSSIHLLFYPI